MDLQIFENSDFGKIRVVEIDGEAWFVLTDVCKTLNLTSPHKVADRLEEDEKGRSQIPTLGGTQGMTVVNESGLYAVILRSDKPQAKPFRKWITSEVIPSIRKTGSYSVNQTDSYMISDPIKRAERWIEEEKVRQALALKVESQSKEIKIMQPKADYFDDLVDRNLLTGFRETAKELKVGERNFIKFLLDNKFVFRDGNKKLMPYANKNDGLFEVKKVKSSKSSWSGVRTMITPKGRETFRLLMKRSKA
jgi:prophage antirepressor-like protein